MPGRASPDPRGSLPGETATILAESGFTIVGALGVDAYDALVPVPWRSPALLPGARSALVLGTGGGRFERAWLEARAAARAEQGEATADPVDGFARRVLERAARSIAAATGEPARARLYCDRRSAAGREPVFADFVALAEACGLGSRSRLGLLLHAQYGPWWSVRGLVLSSLPAADGPPSDAIDPCEGCPAPCVSACRGGAVSLATGFDAAVCARTRLAEPACAARCDARRACVVGPDHAYAAEAEAWYAGSSLAWIRRARDESGG